MNEYKNNRLKKAKGICSFIDADIHRCFYDNVSHCLGAFILCRPGMVRGDPDHGMINPAFSYGCYLSASNLVLSPDDLEDPKK